MDFENQSVIKIQTLTQETLTVFTSSKSNSSFRPKILIKMQENNYLLWNQQVEGVFLAQKMNKLVVNPQIPQKFKTPQDRLSGVFSNEYESWIAQDHTVFIWLLSTISESVLPHVLACKHAFEVWDKIH
ncbi:unnamed protein product [Vicia faba]|uniref:Retrotransposon Copia-like N-terminal domain-containing protein n=1 Tax=Vicia faba TaxID=3906 RepID=A0AAV0YMU3_VICFA|nr:unnamed protein product [Vicia faba]